MKILAIDTATEACSAALMIDDEIQVEFALAPREHTQLILPQMERLLANAQLRPADLDAVSFGQGPGAFTGLRIAAGVTHGIALAADLPVIPISTLAAMAQQCYAEQGHASVLAALDARIREVYWGKYRIIEGRAELQGREQVVTPENIAAISTGNWAAAGSGWQVYENELRDKAAGHVHAVYADMLPSAEFIARLAAFAYREGKLFPVEAAQPVYLRDKVAETIAERQAVEKAGNNNA